MSLLRAIRKHLALKLLLSYLVVIAVGAAVMASATQFAVPSAFDRHMAMMAGMMGNMMGGRRYGQTDLFLGFRAGVSEALLFATAAAAIAATLASILVSRRVVAPVKQMMLASRRISEGHYNERVNVAGNVATGEIDELAQLALSFNQMANRLEQTEAMRRQLIGDVAHELRTPLTSIKGYMEGLIDSVLPAEPDTFQRVYREADRLQQLVHDLQELSWAEAGAFEMRLVPANVAKLVATAVGHLERQFEEKGVALATDIPANLPQVRADRDRIAQVLLNLVGNALQYTPEAGQVRVTARLLGAEVAVSVSDTGIGIAPEHLQHIFDRFYRVDRSRSRASGGSGIGLTIAKHLVEAHGGRIWAESPGPGKGSTFTFTLPRA